jgi:hypothetical protein
MENFKFKNKVIKPTVDEVLQAVANVQFELFPKKVHGEALPPKISNDFINEDDFIDGEFLRPVESLKKLGNGGYAIENPKTKARKWFASSASSLKNAIMYNYVVVHEVIKGECKFFCDLDAKGIEMNRNEFLKHIRQIRHSFGEFFHFFFKMTGTSIAINTFMTISNSDYNSSHIIFEFIDKCPKFPHDNHVFPPRSFSMKCPSQQKPFWKSFAKYLNLKYDTDVYSKIIDTSVYRYNAQFRVVGSASPKPENKIGKGIHSTLVGDEYFRFALNYLDDRQRFDDFLVVPQETKNEFKSRGSSDYSVLDYENEDGFNEPIYYTEYEKQLFAEILKKTTKNIDKYRSWRKAHFRIYCFYHFLPFEKRQRVVREFFASKGWGEHAHKVENDHLCNEWRIKNRHHNYSLEFLRKKFKVPELNWDDFCADEVSYPDLVPGQNKIICMRSGTKTKKTYNFINKFKDQKTLSITYRTSLADEIVEDAKSQGIEFVHYKKCKVEEDKPPQHFVCQLESLYKYTSIIDHYDVVFIDESEAFMGQFNHVLETNGGAIHTLMMIFNLIMNEKNVIFASANLGERTIAFINDFKKEYIAMRNTKKDKQGWSYVDMKKPNCFMGKIEELAKAGKKLIIPINEKTKMFTQISKILEKYGKVLHVTADEQNENKDVKLWTNYDFVIHTPTIEAGVNFLPEHFDHICGFFLNDRNSYDSCYQMLFRARNPKSKIIYLYAQNGVFMKRDDLEDQHEIERRMQIQENRSKSFKQRIDFIDASFVYDKYIHPIQKAMIRHELFKKYSKTHFKKLLINELIQSGIVCDSVVKESEFQMANDKELIISYNEKVIEKIVNKEQGTTQGLVFKLNEIDFPLEKESLEIFNDDKIKASDIIVWLRNYFGLIYNDLGKFNKEQDAIYKFIQYVPIDKLFYKEDLEKTINDFFEKNYDTWTATFGKRKYSLQEILGKKLQYKVKLLNPQLKKCYLKFDSLRTTTILKVYNKDFLNTVEQKIANGKNYCEPI